MGKGKKVASRPIKEVFSSTTPLPATTEARDELEDRVRTHTTAAVSMNRQHNELLPIFCLPSELLAEIFVQYAALERAPPSLRIENRSRHPRADAYRWLRITHVCHHWRTVALSTPKLWATITVTHNAACVLEMVKRAKRAPLDIHIDETASAEALAAILDNDTFLQVRRLEISGQAESAILPEGTQSAPRLRALCIKAASARLVEAFEGCAMPNLEELELEFVDPLPKWTSPLLVSTLTRLTLSSPYVDMVDVEMQGLACALAALEGLPLLRHLELKNVIQMGSSMVENLPIEERVVSLPHLESLLIADDALACARLLQHLSFPATTPLVLDCRSLSFDIEPLGAVIASKLCGVTAIGPAPPLLTACFFDDPDRSTCLKCWTSELDASPETLPLTSSASTLPSPDLDIRLAGTFTSETTTAFSSLFCTLPLRDLRSLCIHTDAEHETFAKATWVQCCHSMRSLRSLSVGRWAEGHLADVLAMRMRIPIAEPASEQRKLRLERFWPNLETLRLQGVRMRPFYHDPHDKFLKKLRRALEMRRTAKHPLARLIIWRCENFRAADVKSLEGVVGRVQWDGRDVKASVYGEGGGYEEEAEYGDDDSEVYDDEFWSDGMEEMGDDDVSL